MESHPRGNSPGLIASNKTGWKRQKPQSHHELVGNGRAKNPSSTSTKSGFTGLDKLQSADDVHNPKDSQINQYHPPVYNKQKKSLGGTVKSWFSFSTGSKNEVKYLVDTSTTSEFTDLTKLQDGDEVHKEHEGMSEGLVFKKPPKSKNITPAQKGKGSIYEDTVEFFKMAKKETE
ncbi:hypothetical protein FRB91_010021 [Serendipita sp. 411]|nr:hypothetical protein FRC18_010359 [Serendipita sp. 400]KAG8849364.1 hypothetical protein FRB91_010021 [Serendipita sp. 411]